MTSMNQALNPSSIRFCEPVEVPAAVSQILPIAHGVGNCSHLITEAVAFVWSDDLPSWYKGRWIVRQRDTDNNLIRESTATYADAKAAFNAYWYASEDDPLDFEPWVAPIWASACAEAA
jgi:hypothetical protein